MQIFLVPHVIGIHLDRAGLTEASENSRLDTFERILVLITDNPTNVDRPPLEQLPISSQSIVQ